VLVQKLATPIGARTPRRYTPEWQHSHDHWADKADFPGIDLDDPVFTYR
jgi:hypothetical protein